MHHFTEFGLSNTKEMLERAEKGHYAVPAFYPISIEQFNAIGDVIIATKTPMILLASPNLFRQLEPAMLSRLAQGLVDRVREAGIPSPIALHLDHGHTYEECVAAIENGFSSVMIDGSLLPFEENIALVKRVVEYAHRHDVSVEAELGILSGDEEDASKAGVETLYTDPNKAIEFIRRSGCDSLAISIGTQHGLVKMKPNPDGSLPELRYDILDAIEKEIPDFPIVLHGSSNIDRRFVEMINEHGGKVAETVGIPDKEISKAATRGVAKVNIATDGWICALAHTRRLLDEHPEAIDSRVFTLKTRAEMKELYLHKINVLGSANHYYE